MAQLPVGDGDPYWVIRVLSGAQRSVGNRESPAARRGPSPARRETRVGVLGGSAVEHRGGAAEGRGSRRVVLRGEPCGGRSGIWSADGELIAEAGAAPDEVARAVFVESEPERLRKSRPASRGECQRGRNGCEGIGGAVVLRRLHSPARTESVPLKFLSTSTF